MDSNTTEQDLVKVQEEIIQIRIRMQKLETAYFGKMETLRKIYMEARSKQIRLLSILNKNVKNK